MLEAVLGAVAVLLVCLIAARLWDARVALHRRRHRRGVPAAGAGRLLAAVRVAVHPARPGRRARGAAPPGNDSRAALGAGRRGADRARRADPQQRRRARHPAGLPRLDTAPAAAFRRPRRARGARGGGRRRADPLDGAQRRGHARVRAHQHRGRLRGRGDLQPRRRPRHAVPGALRCPRSSRSARSWPATRAPRRPRSRTRSSPRPAITRGRTPATSPRCSSGVRCARWASRPGSNAWAPPRSPIPSGWSTSASTPTGWSASSRWRACSCPPRARGPPAFWGVPLTIVLSFIFVEGAIRFRAPADPFVVMLAAAALARGRRARCGRRPARRSCRRTGRR